MSDLKNVSLTINVPFPLELSFARQQATKHGEALMVITAKDECLWFPVSEGTALIQAGATTKQTPKGLVYDGVKGKRFVGHKIQLAGEKHATVSLYREGESPTTGTPPTPTTVAAPQPFTERPAALQTPPEPMPWDGDAKEPESIAQRMWDTYVEMFERARDYGIAHNKKYGQAMPMTAREAQAMAATAFIETNKRSR